MIPKTTCEVPRSLFHLTQERGFVTISKLLDYTSKGFQYAHAREKLKEDFSTVRLPTQDVTYSGLYTATLGACRWGTHGTPVIAQWAGGTLLCQCTLPNAINLLRVLFCGRQLCI